MKNAKQKIKMSDEGWQCPQCTFINSFQDIGDESDHDEPVMQCVMCGWNIDDAYGVGGEPLDQLLQGVGPAMRNLWECLSCGRQNDNGVWRCNSCSTVKNCQPVPPDEKPPPRPVHPDTPPPMKKKKTQSETSTPHDKGDSSSDPTGDGESNVDDQAEQTNSEQQDHCPDKKDNEPSGPSSSSAPSDQHEKSEKESSTSDQTDEQSSAAKDSAAPSSPRGIIITDFSVFDVIPYSFRVPEEALERVSTKLNMPLIRNVETDVSNGALERLLDEDREQIYGLSCDFSPFLISEVVWNSGFPMAIDLGEFLFAARLTYRCVLYPLSDLHVQRKTRKRARRFRMSHNKCFDDVIAFIVRQRGFNWICPRLIRAFRHIFQHPGQYKLKMHSFEMWSEDDKMIAVELGYSVGAIYCSLSGGMIREPQNDGVGSVQLALLGLMLQARQFKLWDLGMPLKYKASLNARTAPRSEWLELHQRYRSVSPLELDFDGKKNCLELYDEFKSIINSMS